MDGTATLILAVAALALTALFGWAGARPPNVRKGPRIVPYRFLMLITAAVAILLIVHLINLAGVRTGR
jgi:hypothetical protein